MCTSCNNVFVHSLATWLYILSSFCTIKSELGPTRLAAAVPATASLERAGAAEAVVGRGGGRRRRATNLSWGVRSPSPEKEQWWGSLEGWPAGGRRTGGGGGWGRAVRQGVAERASRGWRRQAVRPVQDGGSMHGGATGDGEEEDGGENHRRREREKARTAGCRTYCHVAYGRLVSRWDFPLATPGIISFLQPPRQLILPNL